MRGKDVRLSRMLDKGKALIIPMDHGITIGPVRGLKWSEMKVTIQKVVQGGATAILLHKGIFRLLEETPNCGMILHLSASTKLSDTPNWKVTVGSIEEAVRLGVDAISIHVNLGSKFEAQMLESFGKISDACDKWQIPLISMVYPRGINIKDPYDPEVVAHAARVGAELGADIIKTNYTGSYESFKPVVEGSPVPVVIAGGPKVDTNREFLQNVKDAMKAGAIGVAAGRNVFQHDNPTGMVSAIAKIIKDNGSIEEALQLL
ncbi:MAG: class I fructose-bisphosphate aldolase family protein [Candidatus Helarchaeota archaeon]|nr:class I fructose-bisphosphate aldolase family protein [Candidatus Helarchaeota archaeon]